MDKEKTLTTKQQLKDKYSVIKTQLIAKLKINHINDMIGVLVNPGEIASIVTQKKISRHSFTEWVLINNKIDEMYITTYRMSYKNAALIAKQINDKNIGYCKILISQNYKMLLGQSADKIDRLISRTKNFDIITEYNHSKITLIKSSNNYYVITGSGNYSENDHIEEYQIINNKELFDFHKGWINGAS